ncbi:MAG: hypothetical protein V8Q79_02875, partial [Christensenellales bacterium]
EYTAKSWQDSVEEQQPPSLQLFWKFAQKPLLEWRQMSAPTGTDESTARTITVQADISYSGETRTYEYDALVLLRRQRMEDLIRIRCPRAFWLSRRRRRPTPT